MKYPTVGALLLDILDKYFKFELSTLRYADRWIDQTLGDFFFGGGYHIEAYQHQYGEIFERDMKIIEQDYLRDFLTGLCEREGTTQVMWYLNQVKDLYENRNFDSRCSHSFPLSFPLSINLSVVAFYLRDEMDLLQRRLRKMSSRKNRSKLVKFQALWRGYHQRWKCPCFIWDD
jgi:hypothetical protein